MKTPAQECVYCKGHDCPECDVNTPANECNCERFSENIVTTEYCPIHRGVTTTYTPAQEWREEAINITARLDREFFKGRFSSSGLESIEEIIRQELTQHSAQIVEKLESLKDIEAEKAGDEGTIYANNALDQAIDVVKHSSQP